ncbi:hypothetical protein BVRB_4g096900 [Beta vulgaris subsp. vulgaris]|uniref:Uncharacterized protein n=1 Tax=Beta vulgaris subsp. vulgaris TaxID=3555 RepID=A0A0J8BAM1_BETVV|nr:hypothetical protein BVRB_4g096900 [Beta vulgaris subsp. vulgaris]
MCETFFQEFSSYNPIQLFGFLWSGKGCLNSQGALQYKLSRQMADL